MKKILKYICFLFIINLLVFNVNAEGSTVEKIYICQTEALIMFRFAGYMIYIAKILVPIIIVGLAIFDLFKVVMSADIKDLNASIKKLVNRSIIGIAIFFIPTITNILIEFFDGEISEKNAEDFTVCTDCLLRPYSDECDKETNKVELNSEILDDK